MSYPPCYTRRMNNMKNEMKNNKANNLRLGAIYINANTGTPCRLVHIVPCQGVWLEAYDGEGYGDTVKFEDVHYADADEVEDFLADYRVYNDVTSTKLNNGIESTLDDREYAYGKEVIRDSDGSMVVGWYDDNDGNDYRCRD